MTILGFLASFCNFPAEEKISCMFLGINVYFESQNYVGIKAFLLEKKKCKSHFTRLGPGSVVDGEAAGIRVDLFFSWVGANRKGFMRWRKAEERK